MIKSNENNTIKRLILTLIILFFCSLIVTTARAGEALPHEEVFENFNNGQADHWIDDGSGVWSVTNKVYRMTGTGAGALRASCYNASFYNFTYQVDVRRMQGNPDASQGMIFRLTDNGDFYIFAIASSGYCSAYKFNNFKGSELIPWTPTPAIKQGLKVWNTLRIVCKGTTMNFYINDELLETVEDNSSPSSGMVGVVAVDENNNERDAPIVDFDNVRLSRQINLSSRRKY